MSSEELHLSIYIHDLSAVLRHSGIITHMVRGKYMLDLIVA